MAKGAYARMNIGGGGGASGSEEDIGLTLAGLRTEVIVYSRYSTCWVYQLLYPTGTRRCCDVESTSPHIVCPVISQMNVVE